MLLAFIKQPALFIFTDLDPSQVALDLNLGRIPNAHDWPSKYNRNVSYVKQHDIVRCNDKLNIPNLRFSLPIATQLSLYNYLLFFTGNCAIHKKKYIKKTFLKQTARTKYAACIKNDIVKTLPYHHGQGAICYCMCIIIICIPSYQH